MKKYLALFLILSSLFILSSCTAKYEAVPEDIIGTWEYSNHTELKEYLTDVLDDSYFFKVYYCFNEDGSGSSWIESSPEKKLEFNYEFDGKIITMIYNDGTTEDIACEMHKDYFTVKDGENDMKFNRID